MKITRHALDRGKERMGLGDASTQRLAARALEKGLKHSDATGRLKRYLDRLYLSHGKANNIRIYGEKVFLFKNEVLITILNLPNEFKKAALKKKEGA